MNYTYMHTLNKYKPLLIIGRIYIHEIWYSMFAHLLLLSEYVQLQSRALSWPTVCHHWINKKYYIVQPLLTCCQPDE